MLIATVLALVVVGSVLFHVLSPWWFTPIASNWRYIDDTISFTFWITGVVFAVVVLFLAYCVWRFRHQPGRRAAYEPENKRLETWLAIVTGIGVAAMLAPGLVVWGQFITVPAGASAIEVVGQQWQWAYRLPGKDGQLGTADTRAVTAENPLGVNPDDPKSLDDVIVQGGELHLPVGKPVALLLRSIDALHNFYVPEFRAKMDMLPGSVTYYWVTPTRTGTFEALCAELCGVGHPYMRGTVIVDTETDYQAWLDQQQTFEQMLAPAKTSALE
jgi:cytochrome c oxidase subunit 2